MQIHKQESRSSQRGATSWQRPFIVMMFLSSVILFSNCRTTRQVSQNATQPSPTPSPASTFDGQRAFEHVRKQVEFGPRPAGSAELAKAKDYIAGQLHSFGVNVSTDEFAPQTPIGVRKMVNITGEIPGESSEVIIISSHYDTKLYKEFTFVGANDGGSSTGALLELARVIAASGKKPRFTYRFVFFDGEEAFCEGWDECKNNGEPDHTYGSRRYVSQLKQANELKKVRALILLDMVGYKELIFGRDKALSAPWLLDIIWGTAREMGFAKNFAPFDEGVGSDDHEPFVLEKIPSADIIQISTYPFWHKPGDTLDKISPESLKIVGDVVLLSLPRIEQRLSESNGG